MTEQSSNYKSSDKWAGSRQAEPLAGRIRSAVQSSSINSFITALLLSIDPL